MVTPINIERLQERFYENFKQRGELGASISVWVDGAEMLNLAHGWCDRQMTLPWNASSPVLIWSSTKGMAAACVLKALAQADYSLENAVADLWPEFAAAGKEALTIGQLLSHQAGLAALDQEVSVLDYPAVIRALEQQAPLWAVGHGYHPRTFGFLADELVRRLSGIPLGAYWEKGFEQPLGLEAWIGVPEDVLSGVVPVFPAKVGSAGREQAFAAALADPQSLTARAFASPKGLHSVASMNTPEVRRSAFPGFGGIATASGLAKFYSSLIGAPQPFYSWMTQPLVSGFDQVLQVETSFSAGFMKSRHLFGPSPSAFGHPGAGGSVGFADPENGVAFAYVMNQMEASVMPGDKARSLISALYQS